MALVAPVGAETPTSESAQATLSLSAVLSGGGAPLTGGLRWRVFGAQADPDGSHPLIVESGLAQPTLTIPPGDYVVHVAFGLASAAKRLTLGAEVRSERLTLSAGALRIEGTLADAPIDPSKLSLAIYVPQNRNPLGKLVYAKGKAGDIIGLPEGSYHIVSTYLDTVGAHSGVSAAGNSGKSAVLATPAAIPSNSVVNADIKVNSGKRIDVTIRHRCATLTLKLVNKPRARRSPIPLSRCSLRAATSSASWWAPFPRSCSPRASTSSSRATNPRSSNRRSRFRQGWTATSKLLQKRAANKGRDRMQTFFVQIKCALGRTYEVASALAEAEIASEIYSIAGDYDILAKFYVESNVDIGHFVGHKVQVIPGIADTRTIITFKAF